MFKSIWARLVRILRAMDRKSAALTANDTTKNISVGLQNPAPTPRIGRWS